MHRSARCSAHAHDAGPCETGPEDFLELLPNRVSVRIEGREVRLAAWLYRVRGAAGQVVPVYLLDAALPENDPADRLLTGRLYGGDARYRLAQEVLLGIGGVAMLRDLGYRDTTTHHMNEGHSGFAVLEAIRARMEEEGLSFEQAAPRVSRQVVFTTHTPVPAGHDRFNSYLIDEHLGPLRAQLGLSHDDLMGLGRENPGNPQEEFCMTVLALKLSRRANAVPIIANNRPE